MSISLIAVQRNIILSAIRKTAPNSWKTVVLDDYSRRLLYNVLTENSIVKENVLKIDMIETCRAPERDTDVLYILSPKQHVVDCLLADLDLRRYQKTYILWTSVPCAELRQKIDRSESARSYIVEFSVLNIDFFPCQSNLAIFHDPWSFLHLYHPRCTSFLEAHIKDLAAKIAAVCISLDENPIIRYFKAPINSGNFGNNTLLSSLCDSIAQEVQSELDLFVKYHPSFPTRGSRPRGVLYVLDRSLDFFAPLLHEFTYEAMVHDLLPIQQGDKLAYKTLINEGQSDEEYRDMEITENDTLWTENRHCHMKDTIDRLMTDFQKFLKENPHFANSSGKSANLNDIKDMLATLPQFRELKDAYTLHLTMAQDCMNIFQKTKLPDVALLEQALATGVDEMNRKPKNTADQLVRLLDDSAVTPTDRLRLIALYSLHQSGLIPSDRARLLAHANLPVEDENALVNMSYVGVKVNRELKEKPLTKTEITPSPTNHASRTSQTSGSSLSANNERNDDYNDDDSNVFARFTPRLKNVLEGHISANLDPTYFPFVKPGDEQEFQNISHDVFASGSLRAAAKPTWAKQRSTPEPKQRIIVFMAGGATYSESRSCCEVSKSSGRQFFLVTSHMLSPPLYLRQLTDLSVNEKSLRIPALLPKQIAPSHVFHLPKPPPSLPSSASLSALPLSSGNSSATLSSFSGNTKMSSRGNGASSTLTNNHPRKNFTTSKDSLTPHDIHRDPITPAIKSPRITDNVINSFDMPGYQSPYGPDLPSPDPRSGKKNKLFKIPDKKKHGLFSSKKERP